MLYLSSSCFQTDILRAAPRELPHGFAGVELSGGNAHLPDTALEAGVEALRARGFALLFHNYFPVPARPFVLNFASANPAVLEASLRLAGQATDLCARHGCPYYSFHPGYLADAVEQADGHFAFPDYSGNGYGAALARFHASFPRLHALAAGKGVRLAVENLFLPPEGPTSLNTTFGELQELLAPLPGDVLLLLDLGHLNVAASLKGFDRDRYLADLLAGYGERIAEIHLSGNAGRTDDHLPLRAGDWQLEALAAFASLPGPDGRGVNVTIESRRLGPETLAHTAALVRDAWGRAPDHLNPMGM